MWGNMARLAAEYIFLDRIFDFDPAKPGHGRIEVSPESIAHFERIAAEDRPHILFTAHLGNFELLPVAAAAFGMKVTALFRPPNNPYLADYILSTRRSNMGDLQPSSTGASFALADIGQCYVDYVRLMAHLGRVAPGLVHHIDYAALVADPESQLRPALTHLGLDWDPAILEFHKLDRVVRTPSSEQVRRPLNRDGMEVWRPYAEWLGPLRDALGDLAE